MSIVLINTSTVNTGDLTVNTTPPTAGTIVPGDGNVGESNTFTIPAGAYTIKVYNNNIQPITVNGETLNPGDHKPFESRENPVENRYDFCPAVTIVTPAGGSAYYVTERPSS